MDYALITLISFVGGGFCVIALNTKWNRIQQAQQAQKSKSKEIETATLQIDEREQELTKFRTELTAAKEKFDKRFVSYKELQDENTVLKRDLHNLALQVRKLQLDDQSTRLTQEEIDKKTKELGERYLHENVKWIGNSLTANNYSKCKDRLLKVIERCRRIGFIVTPEEEATFVAELKTDYEAVVRAALEREEQARIKAQIREEQKLEREIQREQERLDREKKAIEAALEKALVETADEHSAEIEALRARLSEAEDKQRAISQAQLTKSGFVYVISNIGSFGEEVFKIGMTRRLEPLDRVRELGDASVPFPFDVHMMISCENAPSLENAIHRRLLKQQVNRTNPRKEFFRSDIESIAKIIQEEHGEIHYVADAEALEYRQSLSMSDEDQEFIEHIFEEADDEEPLDDEPVDAITS